MRRNFPYVSSLKKKAASQSDEEAQQTLLASYIEARVSISLSLSCLFLLSPSFVCSFFRLSEFFFSFLSTFFPV
jgi:hypothetical protein